jgi:hypothetical protein
LTCIRNADLTGNVSSIPGPHKIWSFIGHGIQASSFDFQLQVSLIFFLWKNYLKKKKVT